MSLWSEAMDAFEQATRAAPGDAESWAYLALACQNLHELNRAAAAYSEAIRLNPTLVICRYNLGILALKAGDGPAAVEQLEALKNLDEELASSLEKLIQTHTGATP